MPENVQMKVNRSPKKGEPYPSVQLNKLVDLKLNEKEFEHAINYLSTLGIRVGGLSVDLDGEFDNYDYISTYYTAVLPEPLNQSEQLDLFIKYNELKDETIRSEIREKLKLSNLRLVPFCAYRLALRHDIDKKELESYGYEGLIDAIEKFNPYMGYKFSTYAKYYIEGYIKKNIPILKHLPINTYYRFHLYKQVVEQEFDRKFTPEDDEMLEDIIELMVSNGEITNDYAIKLRNIFKYIGTSYEKVTENNDIINNNSDDLDSIVEFESLQTELNNVIDTLDPREASVIRLRFGLIDGKMRTLEEVAKIFGLTGERIRQIEAKSLRKLRHPTRSNKIKEFLNMNSGEYSSYLHLISKQNDELSDNMFEQILEDSINDSYEIKDRVK